MELGSIDMRTLLNIVIWPLLFVFVCFIAFFSVYAGMFGSSCLNLDSCHVPIFFTTLECELSSSKRLL